MRMVSEGRLIFFHSPDAPQHRDAPEAQHPLGIASFTSQQVNKEAQQKAEEAKGEAQLAIEQGGKSTDAAEKTQTQEIQKLLEQVQRGDANALKIIIDRGAAAVPHLLRAILAAAESERELHPLVNQALRQILSRSADARAVFFRMMMTQQTDENAAIYRRFFPLMNRTDIPFLLRVMDGSEWNTIYPHLSQATGARLAVLMEGTPPQERAGMEWRLRRAQYLLGQGNPERGWGRVIGALRSDDILNAPPDQRRSIQRDIDRQLHNTGEFTPRAAVTMIVGVPNRARLARVLDLLEGGIGHDPERHGMNLAAQRILTLATAQDATMFVDFFRNAERTVEQIGLLVPMLLKTEAGSQALREAMAPQTPFARRSAIIRSLIRDSLRERYDNPVIPNVVTIFISALEQEDLAPERAGILEAIYEFRLSNYSTGEQWERLGNLVRSYVFGTVGTPEQREQARRTFDFFASERDVRPICERLRNAALPVAERLAGTIALRNMAGTLLTQRSDEPLRETIRTLTNIIDNPREPTALRYEVARTLAWLSATIISYNPDYLRDTPREQVSTRTEFVQREGFNRLLNLNVTPFGRTAEEGLLQYMQGLSLETLTGIIRTADSPAAARRAIILAENKFEIELSRAFGDAGRREDVASRAMTLADALIERHEASRKSPLNEEGNLLRMQIVETLRALRPIVQEDRERYEKFLKEFPTYKAVIDRLHRTRAVLQRLDRIAPPLPPEPDEPEEPNVAQ